MSISDEEAHQRRLQINPSSLGRKRNILGTTQFSDWEVKACRLQAIVISVHKNVRGLDVSKGIKALERGNCKFAQMSGGEGDCE